MFFFIIAAVQDTLPYARAESLLAHHQLPAARAIAESLIAEDPRDEQAHLLLGRVWLTWPTTGRFKARREFRAAARLAPQDPRPLYLESTVGFTLGLNDGESIARRALLKLLAVAPDYRDAWDRFERVFQSPGIWRKADAALSKHPNNFAALEHRAELALRLEHPALADSFLGPVLAHAPRDVEALILRAEAAFVGRQDSAGHVWYDSALANAADDTTGAMWEAVWMIATPEEAARYESLPLSGHRAFFDSFWARRDPNLVTSTNERIAEHFRRLNYVRRAFPLRYPFSSFYYSQGRQALSARFVRGYLQQMAKHSCFGDDSVSAGFLPGGRDAWLALHGLGPDPQSVDSAAGAELMRHAGFDARGLVWVRYGKPDARMGGTPDPTRPCDSRVPGSSALDVEGWLYNTDEGPLTIGFLRATGTHLGVSDPSGDFLFMPITRRQVESARRLLHTEHTSIPAPLSARLWAAFFKDRDSDSSDVYITAIPDTAAAILWDHNDSPVARAEGPGLLALRALPDSYWMGVDVDSAGVLGRMRRSLTIPAFGVGGLRLSSLVLGTDTTLSGRMPVLRTVPADLTYMVGQPVLAYAEVYGLTADSAGRNRYRVRYTFSQERGVVSRLLQGRDQISLEFTREAPARRLALEQVAIDTRPLTPGAYRVTLVVTDLVSGGSPESVVIKIRLR